MICKLFTTLLGLSSFTLCINGVSCERFISPVNVTTPSLTVPFTVLYAESKLFSEVCSVSVEVISTVDSGAGGALIMILFTTSLTPFVSLAAASTLTAILGRQTAEHNKEVTWDAMISGNEKIDAHLNLSQFDRKM